ncbi:hypothetical protein LPTSP3_g25540 [Leptospira kobayashii]|uniref:Caspase domain protein n=1 Tax=Leptospira kobayashii TaxID=1917830 RepID=A0ABN6KEX7_9LEPT|nr:caspase family protein [Leptospira kobayashii]BDA79624.1 hypothetical protein LPTSP3_g25540 [Leptospira kobayashii]
MKFRFIRIFGVFLFFLFHTILPAEPLSKGISGEAGSDSGKRIALIIGINEYKDVGLNDLRKARNDAKGFAKILIQNGEFDSVTLMTDEVDPKQDPNSLYPTKLNIDEKLDSLLLNADQNDTFVFFFSGHGISDYDEKSYLLTQDSILSKPFNSSLSVETVIQKISRKGIRKSILFLDACRDSMFTTKNVGSNLLIESSTSESEIFGILYSTKAGFFSYEDDESSYGVFTKYLIYGMEGRADSNRDRKVSFSELEIYITAAVKDWSIRKNKQQKPFTKYFGEKSGDIILSQSTNPGVSLADVPVIKINPEGVLVRSMILPGWGQYYQGNETKGKIYMGIATVLLLATLESYMDYRSARESYSSFTGIPPTNRFGESYLVNSLLLEPKRKDLQESQNRLQETSFVYALFYLWNLADLALFDAPANELDKKLNFSLYREYAPGSGSGSVYSGRYEVYYQHRF